MTLSTLNTIHRILSEELKKTENAYKAETKTRYEKEQLEDELLGNKNKEEELKEIKKQIETADKIINSIRKEMTNIREALDEIESRDWR